jgi:hypothetical protein|tara:strand:+ start:203 stop:472 length:270 start_codon:yes stop_codon:yes gene_type:complete
LLNFFHVVFSIGFIAVTTHLKAAVAVNVAATETTAVVDAVINISFSGKGTSKSTIGILTFLIPVSVSSVASACTPSGRVKSLGGTTKGL